MPSSPPAHAAPQATPVRLICAAAAVVLALVLSACTSSPASVDHARTTSAAEGRDRQSSQPVAPSSGDATIKHGTHLHKRGQTRLQKRLRVLERARFRILRRDVTRAMHRSRARANRPFVVASLNVLGASHTAGRSGRHGYGSGPSRILRLAGLILSKDVSVVGLQEFQPPQDLTFQHAMGSSFDVYPGMSLGARSSDNSIAWNTSDWSLVEAHTVGIPYFFGRIRDMPYVLLKNRSSGKEVWFMNFHNPANIGGNMAHWRQVALGIEARLVGRLHAGGTPVVLTGDMNDRTAFGCPFTAQGGMHSANGTHSLGGHCYAPGPLDVDWVMGTSDIAFSDYLSDPRTRAEHLSDHPMVTATAHLP